MKILIIGSGGREHAIAWTIKHTSPAAVELFCAPGNAGISEVARLVPISISDHEGLAQFVSQSAIDLTFVGPEVPLAAGIVDLFESKGLGIVGPTSAAARLEASKVFAKDFMARNGVPTAAYAVAETPSAALDLLRSGKFGSSESSVVIKADGLAAGKGVVVANSRDEAEKAITDLMVGHQVGAEAASRIVLEETLTGPEASILLFSDGKDYALMPAARDHKRIGEGDTGPNTGGMGSITDNSIIDDATLQTVVRTMIEPTLLGAQREGFPFKGVLFLGLMLTPEGPKLLEYNVRFGDPETQAILVRLKTDLVSILQGIQNTELGRVRIEWEEGSSACVVAANRGYPGKHDHGEIIEGLDEFDRSKVQIFHAGTAMSDEGKVLATGGRVLGVTAAAPELPDALKRCYEALKIVHWPGVQFRKDIGQARLASGNNG
ncbi:MAG: phosphoribosylamine--glycine ligase [Acidobacteria bacterium]|nr:MAG: phosphoribosylamine--glycine ligase [Acidobacteriota bacterium]